MNDTLQTSQNGLEFIAKWEGCVLKPYKDIAGLRTIGIGHLIKPGENFPDGVAITKEQALELLAQDVKLCEDSIKKNIKVPLEQNQFDALVSFGFNCGIGVYSSSDACKSLNAGNYEAVPEKLLLWSTVKINGKMQINQGLYNRRKSEGELFSKKTEEVLPVEEVEVSWTKESLTNAQEKLKNLGLYNIKVDGVWGPATAAAISSFSTKAGVSAGKNPKQKVPQAFYNALFEIS